MFKKKIEKYTKYTKGECLSFWDLRGFGRNICFDYNDRIDLWDPSLRNCLSGLSCGGFLGGELLFKTGQYARIPQE